MADTSGGDKQRKGKSAGPARPGGRPGRDAGPAKAAASKTLGRRKPAQKAVPKAAPGPDKRTAAASAQAGRNGQQGRAPPAPEAAGTDWDAFAEKAQVRIEETAHKAGEAARKAGVEAKKMAVDLSEGFDKAFGKLRVEAEHMVKKGQHTRMRLKFRGKPVGPEMPVAVVAAAELASLWWAGPLRLLLAHVVGQAVLEVEFINDAQAHVTAGKAFLSSGDLTEALREFDRALEMDRGSAAARLGRGICFKLRGEKDAARKEFLSAEAGDPRGESGREARRHLDNLG